MACGVRQRQRPQPAQRVPVVNLRGDPPRTRVAGATVWEFYERGGWKPMAEDIQVFMDEQYNLVEQTGMCLDAEKRTMYWWDFRRLTQTRWHLDSDAMYDDDVWELVKTRSIRRVAILSAPANPVG